MHDGSLPDEREAASVRLPFRVPKDQWQLRVHWNSCKFAAVGCLMFTSRSSRLSHFVHVLKSATSMSTPTHSDSAVAERYAAAAEQREAALCCPVSYDTERLKQLPEEIIEKDYGCGDPTRYVKPGAVSYTHLTLPTNREV